MGKKSKNKAKIQRKAAPKTPEAATEATEANQMSATEIMENLSQYEITKRQLLHDMETTERQSETRAETDDPSGPFVADPSTIPGLAGTDAGGGWLVGTDPNRPGAGTISLCPELAEEFARFQQMEADQGDTTERGGNPDVVEAAPTASLGGMGTYQEGLRSSTQTTQGSIGSTGPSTLHAPHTVHDAPGDFIGNINIAEVEEHLCQLEVHQEESRQQGAAERKSVSTANGPGNLRLGPGGAGAVSLSPDLGEPSWGLNDLDRALASQLNNMTRSPARAAHTIERTNSFEGKAENVRSNNHKEKVALRPEEIGGKTLQSIKDSMTEESLAPIQARGTPPSLNSNDALRDYLAILLCDQSGSIDLPVPLIVYELLVFGENISDVNDMVDLGLGGEVPLLFAAAAWKWSRKEFVYWPPQSGLLDLLLRIDDQKANVHFVDEKGNDILFYAALYGDLEVVELLLSAGAETSHRNNDGQTCLHFAIMAGNHTVFTKLLPQLHASLDVRAEGLADQLVTLIKHNYANIWDFTGAPTDKGIIHIMVCLMLHGGLFSASADGGLAAIASLCSNGFSVPHDWILAKAFKRLPEILVGQFFPLEWSGFLHLHTQNTFTPESESEVGNCAKCFGLSRKRVRLYCGHDFCRKCIIRHGRQESTCPLCQAQLCIDIRKPYTVPHDVSRQQIFCHARTQDIQSKQISGAVQIKVGVVPVLAFVANQNMYTIICKKVVDTLQLKTLDTLKSQKFRKGDSATAMIGTSFTCLEPFVIRVGNDNVTMKTAIQVDPAPCPLFGIQLGHDFLSSVAVESLLLHTFHPFEEGALHSINPKHAKPSDETFSTKHFDVCHWCNRVFPRGMLVCRDCQDCGVVTTYCSWKCKSTARPVHRKTVHANLELGEEADEDCDAEDDIEELS